MDSFFASKYFSEMPLACRPFLLEGIRFRLAPHSVRCAQQCEEARK